MALPLTLPPFMLDATSSVQVTIVSNYDTAQVNFYSGAIKVYSLTLLQTAPVQWLPDGLQVGDFVIQEGSVQLQIPSPIQAGTVTLRCTYTDLNVTQSTPLNAIVASWALNQ